eukprot:6173020-Pleurochrysis_carterae.AAC.1
MAPPCPARLRTVLDLYPQHLLGDVARSSNSHALRARLEASSIYIVAPAQHAALTWKICDNRAASGALCMRGICRGTRCHNLVAKPNDRMLTVSLEKFWRAVNFIGSALCVNDTLSHIDSTTQCRGFPANSSIRRFFP